MFCRCRTVGAGRIVGEGRFVGVSRDSGKVLAGPGSSRSPREVEGATGQGSSLASASGPPLHLLQQAAAALVEGRSREIIGKIRILCAHFWITQTLFMAN